MTSRRRDAVLGLESQLWLLGRRFRQRTLAVAEEISPGLGLNAYAVLESLAQRGPTRQGDLAEKVALDKTAMSRLVQELLELELVERHPDPSDARAQLVDLSPAGREQMSRIRAGRHAAFEERLADWTDEELTELSRALARYNAAFTH